MPRRFDDSDPEVAAPGPRGQLPSGRHGLSDDAVAASQRSRILDAMREALAGGGYAKASLLRITKLAGVSRKTFYVHFADKEECFIAIYLEARERLYAPSTRARSRPGRWPARTVAGTAAWLEALAADPASARIVFVDVFAAGDRARELRNAKLVELMRAFEPTAADRKDLGLPPGPVGGATEIALGGITEMIYREIVEGRIQQLPLLLPDFAYATLSLYLGPDTARAEVEALTGRQF